MPELISTRRLGFASIFSWALALAAAACDSTSRFSPQGDTLAAGAVTGGANAGVAGNHAGTPGSNPNAGNGTTPGVGAPNGAGGAAGAGGATAGGISGTSGAAGSAGAGTTVALPPLVTSAPGAYWKTDVVPADSTETAIVTVDESVTAQTWEGFGGAFNELGWSFLTSSELQQHFRSTWLRALRCSARPAATRWRSRI